LYVLDEPTTGHHPSDVAKLMKQLGELVGSGNTVLVVEHDMPVARERLDR
jgi:excinuclease ABC subunit A